MGFVVVFVCLFVCGGCCCLFVCCLFCFVSFCFSLELHRKLVPYLYLIPASNSFQTVSLPMERPQACPLQSHNEQR